MAIDRTRLMVLAEAVADGRPLNWPDAESGTENDEDRALVRQLRFLAGVAEAHRSVADGGPVDTTGAADDVPERWGVLEIRERLGSGAFGSVYRAWDPRLAREVALKLLHAGRLDDRQAPAVVEEGCLLARVRHPHVIAVYGADQADGRVGIWMELIRGLTLEEVLRRQGPFSAREATSIGEDLCAALAAVHAAGLVHRDVKTQNVMREEGGRIVLMDFGAGGDVRTRSAIRGLTGTPVCMAPELFDGHGATPQSDLYSLGILLFRIVTQRYPILARTAEEVRQAHARAEQQRLIDLRADLPPAFVKVVERALAPDPEQRFKSAGAMQAALSEVFQPAVDRSAVPEAAPQPRKKYRALVVAGLLVAGLGLATATQSGRAWVQTLFVHPSVKNVAVLPFTNLSGEPSNDYFADGVTEVLVSRLGMIGSLRILAPSSINAIPPAERDGANLQKRLAANYLVEGSVNRQGERIRLTARLVEASTGTLRWTETFERPLGDMFAMQGELAAAIGAELGARLNGDTKRRLHARQTTSIQAQDAYLKGRHLLYTFSRSSFPEARSLFERAVALDPSYAMAHASLARIYALMLDTDMRVEQPLQPLAIAAAAKAMELGADIAEANVAFAETKFRLEREWEAADAAFRRAVAISPHSSLVLSPYSRYLCATGNLDDALKYARDGAAADPLSAEMMASVGITHYYRREYDEALRQFDRALEVAPAYGPGFLGRARVYAEQGKFQEATDQINKAMTLVGSTAAYRAELARTHAMAGWNNMAEQGLGGLLLEAREIGGELNDVGIGYVYAALGDNDRAFEWLNRALDHYYARLLFLKVDPRADPLRSDPRYAALVQRLGLKP
jgi:eukaryotic-like serine/threonine-protein kinase